MACTNWDGAHHEERRDCRSEAASYERSFKADLILQSLVPGASVSATAMAAVINANLLFKWRRYHLRLMSTPCTVAGTLVPVLATPA